MSRTLCLIVLLSLLRFPAARAGLPTAESNFRVHLDLRADGRVSARFQSGILSRLRKLGDVTITDQDLDFVLHVTVTYSTYNDGRIAEYAVSWIGAKILDAPNFLLMAPQGDSFFSHYIAPGCLCGFGSEMGNPDHVSDLMDNLVAQFDSSAIESERKLSQAFSDAWARAKRQSQTSPTPSASPDRNEAK
jgi:hypothetical protein